METLIREITACNSQNEYFIKETSLYYQILIDEGFKENENESNEEEIERAESVYEKLSEKLKRNDSLFEITQKTFDIFNQTLNTIMEFTKVLRSEKEVLVLSNNELVEKLIDLRERETCMSIFQNPTKAHEIKKRLKETKIGWVKCLFDIEELKRKESLNLRNMFKIRQNEENIRKKAELKREIKELAEENNDLKKMIKFSPLEKNEIIKIESWTKMKIGGVVFDSKKFIWNEDISEFDQKVINKSNLIFLIEDEEGNKFGGYVNAKIDIVESWISDPNSFVFSLKPNEMAKFEVKNPKQTFWLCDSEKVLLFAFGENDIYVHKFKKKYLSFCGQTSFNYHGIQNALCGKTGTKNPFTPTRIIVFQLI